MSPLVSILIPAYNSEKWVIETLESALAQTWPEKEIILVDDGSSDGTFDLAARYLSRGVRLFKQDHKGASSARNKAYRECKGDYIQYLDADDLMDVKKVEKQMQVLMQPENKGYVASCQWGRFYSSPADAKFKPEPVWSDMDSIDWLVSSWLGGGMMHPAAWLVPRPIAEAAGGWDETLSLDDDGEYFCRIMLSSRGVKFVQHAKTYYRSNVSGSLSGSRSIAAWDSAFRSLQLNSEHLLNREDSARTKHACATVFQRFIYACYPNRLDLIYKAEAAVRLYGGSNLKPLGGLLFRALASITGWKFAKRFHAFLSLKSGKNVHP